MKVVGYARVSTLEQEHGIDAQRAAIRAEGEPPYERVPHGEAEFVYLTASDARNGYASPSLWEAVNV